MQDYHLNQQELAELRAAHRAARNVREAYRLNAVILLGSGWSPSEVAAALLINDDTVRTHFKRYKEGGIAALERMNYVGRTLGRCALRRALHRQRYDRPAASPRLPL
jgi:predicted ArsR family transcriptional regulator